MGFVSVIALLVLADSVRIDIVFQTISKQEGEQLRALRSEDKGSGYSNGLSVALDEKILEKKITEKNDITRKEEKKSTKEKLYLCDNSNSRQTGPRYKN